MTQRVTANEQPRRIIATLVHPDDVGTGNVYSENHTNFIPIPTGSQYAFLLGVLNSSLMEFIFRRLNSNTQVSAGEINSLPFPPIPDELTLREIETLVLDLLKLGGVDSHPDTIHQTLTYEHRLDILIGSLYGFSPSEVEEIQQRLPSYETVYGIPERVPQLFSDDQPIGRSRVVALGKAIYEERIRHKVEGTERNKFAVIDIYSEDYEIDSSHADATRRLVARHPGAITYTVRIGHPTAYKTGLRSRGPQIMITGDVTEDLDLLVTVEVADSSGGFVPMEVVIPFANNETIKHLAAAFRSVHANANAWSWRAVDDRTTVSSGLGSRGYAGVAEGSIPVRKRRHPA